jgi:hypothetical protein
VRKQRIVARADAVLRAARQRVQGRRVQRSVGEPRCRGRGGGGAWRGDRASERSAQEAGRRRREEGEGASGMGAWEGGAWREGQRASRSV